MEASLVQTSFHLMFIYTILMAEVSSLRSPLWKLGPRFKLRTLAKYTTFCSARASINFLCTKAWGVLHTSDGLFSSIPRTSPMFSIQKDFLTFSAAFDCSGCHTVNDLLICDGFRSLNSISKVLPKEIQMNIPFTV